MRHNISDVARLARVSKSTVSRALNEHPDVSKEARERIEQAIAQLDYQPNPYAQSISSGKTRTVGLLVPNLHSQFYVEIMDGIVQQFSSEQYGLLLYTSEGIDRDLVARVFHPGRTDGVIAITPRLQESEFIELFQARQPFVLVNHRNTDIDAPYVCFNNYAGGYQAGKFLVDFGHRRIACLAGNPQSQSTRNRFDGFKAALLDNGIELPPEWAAKKSVDFETSVHDVLAPWMAASEPPTAIFAYSDLTAMDTIAVIRELGYSVPDDVSVMGFDNIGMARHTRPPLTTISQSPSVLGETGARMLLSIIRNETLKQSRITIEPELVIRDSCRSLT